MRSSINVLADYREVPFEREVVLRCPKEHIAKEMKHLTRGFKRNEPVEKVEKQDVVMLALESELAKFNKPTVPVTVGGGLFDAELEEQLIGHSVGESFTAKVQDKPVAVTIKKANRTIYPEPTDEMAAAYAAEHEELAGIKTVEAYREHVIQEYYKEGRRDAVYGTMEEIMNYVLTHSDWEFDEEELDALVQEYKAQVQEELAEEGKEYDQLQEEELSRFFGVTTLEEAEKMLRGSAEQSIAVALWVCAVHEKDAAAITMDEAMELGWDFLETYVRENMTILEE